MSTPAPSRRSYSDADKAVLLAFVEANDGDLQETSRQTGVPARTLNAWLLGRGVNDDVVQLYERLKSGEDDLLEAVRDLQLTAAASLTVKLLESVDHMQPKEQIDLLGKLNVGVGILTDKKRLERGEATQITETKKSGGLDTYRRKGDTEDANVISEE